MKNNSIGSSVLLKDRHAEKQPDSWCGTSGQCNKVVAAVDYVRHPSSFPPTRLLSGFFSSLLGFSVLVTSVQWIQNRHRTKKTEFIAEWHVILEKMRLGSGGKKETLWRKTLSRGNNLRGITVLLLG